MLAEMHVSVPRGPEFRERFGGSARSAITSPSWFAFVLPFPSSEQLETRLLKLRCLRGWPVATISITWSSRSPNTSIVQNRAFFAFSDCPSQVPWHLSYPLFHGHVKLVI